MQAYLAGEQSAFESLFDRYASRLEALMMRKVSRHEVAVELVQQTFLQFHRARQDFDTSAKVRPWLYTIALNLRRDHMRSAPRRREHPTDEMPDRGQPNLDVTGAADRQLVHMALDELTDTLRVVVELHWFEELSFAEISEALDISKSAAKVRAHRAYEKMRTFISSKDVTAVD
jgi:RNA polymerase sigma-70 factor (ECF subfamily)